MSYIYRTFCKEGIIVNVINGKRYERKTLWTENVINRKRYERKCYEWKMLWM